MTNGQLFEGPNSSQKQPPGKLLNEKHQMTRALPEGGIKILLKQNEELLANQLQMEHWRSLRGSIFLKMIALVSQMGLAVDVISPGFDQIAEHDTEGWPFQRELISLWTTIQVKFECETDEIAHCKASKGHFPNEDVLTYCLTQVMTCDKAKLFGSIDEFDGPNKPIASFDKDLQLSCTRLTSVSKVNSKRNLIAILDVIDAFVHISP